MSGTRMQCRNRVEQVELGQVADMLDTRVPGVRAVWARIDRAVHLIGIDLEPAGLVFLLASTMHDNVEIRDVEVEP